MQPHSGTIISALFHHHHFGVQKKYRVRMKFPEHNYYKIEITNESKQLIQLWVDGQFSGALVWNCDAKVDKLSSERFRMRHHHSSVSQEEWTISKKQVYNGEFRSEKGFTARFEADSYGDGKAFSFTEDYRFDGKLVSKRYDYELEL